jgi:hypothetical protein
MVLSQFPASLLQWRIGGASDQEPRQFKIGTVGSMYSTLDPVNTVAALPRVRDELKKRAIDQATDALFRARSGNYEPEVDLTTLLEACLHSPWLLCSAEAGVAWLAPSPSECDQETVEAAVRLVAALDVPIPVVDQFARQLTQSRPEPVAFLSIPDTHRFQPWEVAWVSGSPERLEELARSVGDFIRSRLEQSLRRTGTVDPWLAEDESGGAMVSEAVESLCASLSEHATAIAPPFVTRDYTIRVEPLAPKHWHRYQNRRVRLAVSLRDDDLTFDLNVAGSGLAVWAGFAIEEAMREVDLELSAEIHALVARSHVSQDDPERAPRKEPSLGERTRLYVLDEPERHLHPHAQEQAARWLSRRVDGRTSLLLATHALPFLSLPGDEVEYALVSRDADRMTRADSITADVWGALDQRTSEAGLGSRAQLIQIARAFLIVEGEHDEAVIRHFYSHALDRHRIVVLPSRGARKVRSLIEAELLALIDVPMIILFDDIHAAEIVGETAPSRKDVAAHALWEMLQHWPAERKQPHVLDFALPDIYCALPEACVRQAVKSRGGSFPGWDEIIQAFEIESEGLGFKEFFVRRSSLPQKTDTTTLLHEILENCRVNARPQLKSAIDEVIERAQSV